jgi:hypothetical protein
MKPEEAKHRRSISVQTTRQRSFFISILKREGCLKFLRREPIGFREVVVTYQCLVCSSTLEGGELVNHFRHDEIHYQIAFDVLRQMALLGEINLPAVLAEAE